MTTHDRQYATSPRQRFAWTITIMVVMVCLLLTMGCSTKAYNTPGASGGSSPALKGYVGLFKDNAVAVFDTQTNRVITTIPIPAGPHGLVITPDGGLVYVSSDGASTVSIISTATNKIVNSIEVGKTPHGLAITPDGKYILCGVYGEDQVVRINAKTNLVDGKVAIPKAHNIAISPDGSTAYVASQQTGSNALVILDVANMKQTGSVPLDKTPRALSFSTDGKQIYFTVAGSDAVQVLDPTNNHITKQISVGESPHYPYFVPKQNMALVVVQGPGKLAIINPHRNNVSGDVEVGKFPHWVAADSEGKTAFVTNEDSNTVSVVDLNSKKVTATIQIGNSPRKIMIQPAPQQSTPGIPGSSGTSNEELPNVNVKIVNYSFNPETADVKVGQTVVWTNGDSVPHTVTGDDGKWGSKKLNQGDTYSYTFDAPGEYKYHCSLHTFMKASVDVEQQ